MANEHGTCLDCRRAGTHLPTLARVSLLLGINDDASKVAGWSRARELAGRIYGNARSDPELLDRIIGLIEVRKGESREAAAVMRVDEVSSVLEAELGGEVPEAAKPVAATQAVKPRATRSYTASEYNELVLSWLVEHHQFDGDSIQQWNPAKQSVIAAKLEIEPARVSEAMGRLFSDGSEDTPNANYRRLCVNGKLLHKFQQLRGESADATGEGDTIDGITGMGSISQHYKPTMVDMLLDLANESS